jgi:hypothetical protein
LPIALAALLSVLEAQAIERPRARLVHDPAEHRAVRGVVTRRAPPDVMEDVDRKLFSGFPVACDSHDQSEDDAMGHLVERMQRELVACGNRLDEGHPGLLRDRRLGVGIEHVAQRCRRSLWTLFGYDGRIRHSPRSCHSRPANPRSGSDSMQPTLNR